MHPSPNPETLRAFLLDRLPEADSTALEEKLILEEEFFQFVRSAEDDLLDDYIEGALPPGDLRRFESQLRSRPELQQRLAVRRALLATLAREAAPAVVPPRPKSATPRRRWFFPAFAATAALAVVCAALFQAHRSRPAAPANVAQAAPAAPGPAARSGGPGEAQALAPAILFFPQHVSRGASRPAPLRLRLNVPRPVTLELELPAVASAPSHPWSVSLARAGVVVARTRGLYPRHVGGIPFVEVEIMPGVLKPGSYQVSLRQPNSPASRATVWDFSVTQ